MILADAGRRRGRYSVAQAFCLIISIIVILGATLLPSQPAGDVDWSAVFCLVCGRASLADALANIALFVPLGAALRFGAFVPWRALLGVAALSLSVELVQFFVPGRDPSLGDVISNTIGAGLGGQLLNLLRVWTYPVSRVAGRLSLMVALIAGGAFVLTDIGLRTSLPQTAYFSGSMLLETSSKPLRLGGTTDPRESFQGRIDEVRIYSHARTASEIQTDMNAPIGVSTSPPDLMAAYDFDQGSGSVLTDVSGHGSHGDIRTATWTDQGRFGGALLFNAPGDVVVISNTPWLELTSTLTLEAWIYPTARQRGWRPILQKEFDTYFLLASSRTGALKPGGGGTFGTSTEIVGAPAMAPINTWTHVALTYDGAVLALYLNGRPAGRRLRWYPGGVVDASLGNVAIPAGASLRSKQLRQRLLSGEPLRVRAVVAAPVSTPAPFLTLLDHFRNELLLVAAVKDDVMFRLRTRAAAAELDSPAVRAPGVMRGLGVGDDVTLTVRRTGRTYCVDVNTRSACGLGFTLGMGWTFFAYSQIPPGWPHAALNAVWMAVLVFPFGFWLRWRWESLLGLLVLAAGIVLPCTIGNLSTSLLEVGAAIVGIVVGYICALGAARAKRHADDATAEVGCR